MTGKYDPKLLRETVHAAPDYALAQATVDRLYAVKEVVDREFAAAGEIVGAIWDREAKRLFGPPGQP